jgi:hypothetical protein
MVSTQHTCDRPRTEFALIWQVCMWCRLGKVLFPSRKPLLKNKHLELYLSWSLSSYAQLFSYTMEPDCSTTQVITLITLPFTPQYSFLPHLPPCINPYSLNALLLMLLLVVHQLCSQQYLGLFASGSSISLPFVFCTEGKWSERAMQAQDR